MRFVSSLPPVPTSPNTRQPQGLTRIHAVKPVPTDEEAVPPVQQQAPRQVPTPPVKQQYQRAEPFEDRRKICRRVSRQPVLVELRSGIERRKQRTRAGDLIDHIDEKA
jgi:hypothetical protein